MLVDLVTAIDHFDALLARITAERRIKAADPRTAIERRGTRAIADVLDDTLDDVLRADLDAPDAAVERVDRHRDAMEAAVLALLVVSAAYGIRKGLAETSSPVDAAALLTLSGAWARNHASVTASGVTATSKTALREALGAWQAGGGSVRDLTRALEPHFGRERADRIAVTETTAGITAGQREAWHAAGVTRYVWQTQEDERTCEECAPLDGNEYDMGDGPTPPLHPNCRCEIRTAR